MLHAGQRLGGYRIDGILGRGGMAEVYRATHLALEREVAIKILSPALNADPTFLLRFAREAKAVARLRHPHIITVHDYGEEGTLAYLVMELAEGGTLRDRARTFCTLSDVVEGIAPVAEALAYAHDRGVIHRDLKPVNVLIDEAGRPLLADFGLARVLRESLDYTEVEGGAGTPNYMAPEQALGGALDRRVDIYALGIVAYELLTGQAPYAGPTPYLIIQRHLTEPPPSIRAALPQAPETLEAAIRRATSKRPADRYDTAVAFLADLRRAAAERPALPVGAALAPQPAPLASAVERASTAVEPSAPVEQDARAVENPLSHSAPDAAASAVPVNPSDAGRASAAVDGAKQAHTPRAAGTDGGSSDSFFVRPAMPARRPTSLHAGHVAAAATLLLVLAGITAVIWWAQLAGRGAVPAPLRWLFDQRMAVRVVLAGCDLALGVLNATLMRIAVLGDYQLSLPTYRRLRQSHRFIGYSTALVALTVQTLTWIALFGDGLSEPMAALVLICGTTLVLLAVTKVAIVRFLPAQRIHLPAIGVTLIVLLAAVFIGSLSAGKVAARPSPVSPTPGASAVPTVRTTAAAAPSATAAAGITPAATAPVLSSPAAQAPVPSPVVALSPTAAVAATPTAAPPSPSPAPTPAPAPLAGFAPFVGVWSAGGATLSTSPDGRATLAFPVGRSCASNPAPCDDPIIAGRVGGSAALAFAQAADPAATGTVTQSNSPTLVPLGPATLTLTHYDSFDIATLSAGAFNVRLCSPQALQQAPDQCMP
jgi:hypothetical protein